MPRKSIKRKHVEVLWEMLEERVTHRELRMMTGRRDAVADRLDFTLLERIQRLESRRYLHQSKYRMSSKYIFEEDMKAIANGDVQPWLNADEFLQKYRMSKANFHKLVNKIRDCEVFQTPYGKTPQFPVEYQLMVFLHYVGTLGVTNPGSRNEFRIGHGTANVFRKRDSFDYYGRKCRYSFSVPIVCDDKRRIRYYLAGWPGSAHDNRIWKNCDLYRNASERFSALQYLFGDSAYECCQHMVAAFRNYDSHPMARDKEQFNMALGSPRVLSEHTIGMLKGRFPWLQSMRNKITDDPNSRRKVVSIIGACIILHDFLIEETTLEEDKFLWEDDDDKSTLTSQEPLGDDDELNQPIPEWATGDACRMQLQQYILELRNH
ncbi:unnamed protein product [Cylindrotheca closterium]|uniref:DDE Tnp4 domain-containing protein n=1 Tax=Cylindrotheca closterium TaxID=2856 RepID=A0AAD2CUG5_9STRA|nr:unnamed protein product [Cylindrotheca closterium]